MAFRVEPRIIQIGREQHVDLRLEHRSRSPHPTKRHDLGDAGHALEGVDDESAVRHRSVDGTADE